MSIPNWKKLLKRNKEYGKTKPLQYAWHVVAQDRDIQTNSWTTMKATLQ